MNCKTVLITGAARRIGAVIARDLHHHGMDIIMHYKDSKIAAEKLSDELNTARAGSAYAIQADLVDHESYSELINSAYRFREKLDVLINNASAFYPTPLPTADISNWEEIVGTNLKAPFFLSQLAAPHLASTNGCIINITDIHAIRPLKGHSLYSVAKAGLNMLTMALAKDLAPEIRVNGIAPGAILWPENTSDILKHEILSRTLLNRTGQPEDIADAVRYLILDADYMTGQILTVDGGRTLFS